MVRKIFFKRAVHYINHIHMTICRNMLFMPTTSQAKTVTVTKKANFSNDLHAGLYSTDWATYSHWVTLYYLLISKLRHSYIYIQVICHQSLCAFFHSYIDVQQHVSCMYILCLMIPWSLVMSQRHVWINDKNITWSTQDIHPFTSSWFNIELLLRVWRHFTRQRTLSESLQHCQTCSISIKSYSMCSRRLIPSGVSEFPYAIMSYLSIHGMHSNDLDTFGLQIRFSRLHAFVQFTNYLPIKTTGLCNCTWKKKERRGGGVCDMWPNVCIQ